MPWTVLALVSVAQFMVILDITVVNVALPSIGEDLGFAAADLQWVVTIYVLFTGGLLLLGGRLADLIGRRAIFLTGLAVFTGASLASGLASSPEALIVSRAAQGLGAALLSPAALSIITTTYEGAQRTTALSVWGAIGAGGAAAGVLLGGILTSWLSWEAIFIVNVPIGLAAAALTLRVVPRSAAAPGSPRTLDLPGALSLVTGLVIFVYAVEGGSRRGWASVETLGLLAAAAALLATFAVLERRASHPLVAPSTWRVRSLVSSATVMLGATGLLVGAFFLSSIHLQHELGFSALETGVAFLPLVVVIGIAAHVGPNLLIRVGARSVVVGALATVGGGYLLLSRVPEGASYAADLLPGYLMIGFGIGLTLVSISVTAMADVDHDRAGVASGLMTTAHELGAAVGVALFSAVAIGAGGAIAGTEAFADGSLAGAALAGGLALLALAAIPAYRPATVEAAAMH